MMIQYSRILQFQVTSCEGTLLIFLNFNALLSASYSIIVLILLLLLLASSDYRS